MVERKASDFVVGHVGGSEAKSKEILKLAEGKVLSIDEAYGLDDELYGKKVEDFFTGYFDTLFNICCHYKKLYLSMPHLVIFIYFFNVNGIGIVYIPSSR